MLELFFTFLKIGLFTFGGGYAMLSLIEDICVEKKKWITHEEMVQITVIAESTPGPVAINCATYVGCRQGGFWGSVAATMGVVVPSFVIIYVISLFLDGFLEIALVANAFRGIRIAVALLILNAGWNMLRKLPKKALPMGICGICVAVMALSNLLKLHISSIALLLTAGTVSLMLSLRKRKGGAA